MSQLNTKCNGCIDLMKFFCALLVISIHTSLFCDVNSYVEFGMNKIVARIAVPFFFMCAGYFFTVKLIRSETKKSVLVDYIKRLIFLYIGWSLVYLLYDVWKLYEHYHQIDKVFIEYIKYILWQGTHFHLWYMPALILGIFLLYTAIINKQLALFTCIAVVLYCVGIFDDSYSGFIKEGSSWYNLVSEYNEIFFTTRNGVFFGFLFVMLGGVVAYNPHYSKLSFKLFGLGLGVSFGLWIVEASLLQIYNVPKDYNIYLMLIPVSFCIFNLILNIEIKMNKTICLVFRSYSMGIYFIHGIFLIIFGKLLNILNMKFSVVFFITVLISSIISIYLVKKLNIPFLRELVK